MTWSDGEPGSSLAPGGMGAGAEPFRAASELAGRTGSEPGVTIVLALGHTIVRQGLMALLREMSEFHIVGEARSGQEAVEPVERLRPNVLIVGLMMPGLNGLEVAQRIHQSRGITHVVVLSMYANQAYVLQALRNGAADLVTAAREVVAGRHYRSPPVAERAIESYVDRAHTAPLTSPWGKALAPASFGSFSNDLLVGNFGDGQIHAFDPHTGALLGTLQQSEGQPVAIDGLWGLLVGTDPANANQPVLYFTAGPNDENHGLFGRLRVSGG